LVKLIVWIKSIHAMDCGSGIAAAEFMRRRSCKPSRKSVITRFESIELWPLSRAGALSVRRRKHVREVGEVAAT
jgi:hypothetical protein